MTERHLLGDFSGKLPERGARPARVGVKASMAAASDPERQRMLWVACNLLCRLRGIVGELAVCVPSGARTIDARLEWPAPRSDLLHDALSESLAPRARGCRVVPAEEDLGEGLDAAVLLGRDARTGAKANFEIHADCAGWLAYVWRGGGAPPAAATPRTTRGGARNPFGAAAAACLSVGEVFKALGALRSGAGAFADSLCFSTYDLQRHDPCGDTPENPALPRGADLGRIVVCGSGAVAHSFCQAICAVPCLRGDLLLVDRRRDEGQIDEAIDDTNLARYVLANSLDEGRPKAEVLCERVRAMCRIGAEHYDDGLDALVNSGALEGAQQVVSCVDNNEARHVIQEQLPLVIRGGSVHEMRSQVSMYDLRVGTACLKCRNPVERPPADGEAAGGLPGAGAGVGLQGPAQACSVPRAPGLQPAPPRCGSLTAESLGRMRSRVPPEFAANFATAFSGTIIAAESVKTGCPPLRATLDGNPNADLFYVFWTCWSRLSPARPRPGCWCCTGRKTPRDVHGGVWGRG